MQVSARNSLLNQLNGELNSALTLIPLGQTSLKQKALRSHTVPGMRQGTQKHLLNELIKTHL